MFNVSSFGSLPMDSGCKVGEDSLKTYPLTFLQIGDMPAYLSIASLHLSEDKQKLILFVDNSPWSSGMQRSKSALLWQLMVVQSRESPFTNHKVVRKMKQRLVTLEEETQHYKHHSTAPLQFNRHPHVRQFLGARLKKLKLKSVTAVVRRLHARRKASMEEQGQQPPPPPNGLYGCVTFELEWRDVRGISYSNELMIDTSLALEMRAVKKREFQNVAQAHAFHVAALHLSTETPAKQMRRNSFDSPGDHDEAANHSPTSVLPLQALKSPSATETEPELASRDSPDSFERSKSNVGFLDASDVEEDENGEEDDGLDAFITPQPSGMGQTFSSERETEFDSFHSPRLPDGESANQSWRLGSAQEHRAQIRAQTCSPEFKIFSVSMDGSEEEGEEKEEEEGKSRRRGSGSSSSTSEHPETFRNRLSYASAVPPSDSDPDLGFPEIPEPGQPDAFAADLLRDRLVVLRFRDPHLPEALRHVIESDLSLLKKLESGLPHWSVFAQSYPLLCRLYRPWMRHLALYAYFVVSFATVLIGFHDLYKNVPVLREAIAGVLGPASAWIESWGVAVRLRYLGTMLFLHNLRRALAALSSFLRGARSLLLTLVDQLAGPLRVVSGPVLSVLGLFGARLWGLWSSFVWGWAVIGREARVAAWKLGWSFWAIGGAVGEVLVVVLAPLARISLLLWTAVAAIVAPVASGLWLTLRPPLRLLSTLLSALKFFLLLLLQLATSAASRVGSTARMLAPASGTATAVGQSAPSVPHVWKQLWNDIFHKVFKAMRSILNGLLLFLLSCNRHRLSTYHYANGKWRSLRLFLSGVLRPPNKVAGSIQASVAEASDSITATPQMSGYDRQIRSRTHILDKEKQL